MAEALLLVDVLKDFRHEDGDALLESYRRRHPRLLALLAESRERGVPVVYANDGADRWGSDWHGLVHEALEHGKAGTLVAALAPRAEDIVLLKDAYSAFEGTRLASVLDELGADRVVLAGTATEMCVLQTATDAESRGLAVTVRGDASASVDPADEASALDWLARIDGIEVVRPLE